MDSYYIRRDNSGECFTVGQCPDCLALVLSSDVPGHARWHALLGSDLRAIAESAAMANAGVDSVGAALSEHTGEYA